MGADDKQRALSAEEVEAETAVDLPEREALSMISMDGFVLPGPPGPAAVFSEETTAHPAVLQESPPAERV